MSEPAEGPGGPPRRCPRCGHRTAEGGRCSWCGTHARRRPRGGPATRRAGRSAAPLLFAVALLLAAAVAVTLLENDEASTRVSPRVSPAAPRAAPAAPKIAPETPAATDGGPTSEPESEEWFDWDSDYGPASEPEPEPAASRPLTATYSWYEGADGYLRAREEAAEEEKALFVYFYTDWCGYCRELERELLTTARVEEHLKYLAKVRVNPERGAPEAELARHYGVGGYPALFIHRDVAANAARLSRQTRGASSGRRLKTPEEFVETVRRAAGS